MIPDVAVIGAGSFGTWIAWHLRQSGLRVVLMDGYGAANSRASSGGESRIIRAGYGPREIYTQFSIGSLRMWRELAARTDSTLFHPCGALWLAPQGDPFALETVDTLARYGVRYEHLETAELVRRYPWFQPAAGTWAIFEPEAGALMARRAVQTLARELDIERGLLSWTASGAVRDDGSPLRAGTYVFACGPWLGKMFPDILGCRIQPSRQEVFFFGTPPGGHYGPERVPCWIDVASKFYGMGDLENRGFKVASDLHGHTVDPDTLERVASDEGLLLARAYLAERIPSLQGAPLVETRVCQYENTANGDYILDQHPDHRNVWIAGGGSGHGFKHGPAVGEYLAGRILGRTAEEDRFSLASKSEIQGVGPRSSFYRQ